MHDTDMTYCTKSCSKNSGNTFDQYINLEQHIKSCSYSVLQRNISKLQPVVPRYVQQFMSFSQSEWTVTLDHNLNVAKQTLEHGFCTHVIIRHSQYKQSICWPVKHMIGSESGLGALINKSFYEMCKCSCCLSLEA